MKQQQLDVALEYMRRLLEIPSPSGYTAQVADYLMETLAGMGLAPVKTVKGAVQVNLGGEGAGGLMLASHVDTLGAMVRAVKPTGRLRVAPIGGLNPFNSEAENVAVVTRDGRRFEGTLQLENASVHVNGELNKTLRSWDNVEVVLDEEVKTADAVRALGIGAGDFVCVCPRTTITKTGFIKSRFLDDKLSAAILLAMAHTIRQEGLTPLRPLYLNFTTYEEVGHGGAADLPQGLEEFISVDMGCVGEDLGCDETMVSICALDSNGPSSFETVNGLVAAARRAGAPYAVDVYPHYGSDADVALKSGAGVRHCVMGPGVYASHGYERSHCKGVAATYDLLMEYVRFA